MQFYPPLTIGGVQHDEIEKPVVMVLTNGTALQFDTVEQALARIEEMDPTDPLPENIYCMAMSGWQVVQFRVGEPSGQDG